MNALVQIISQDLMRGRRCLSLVSAHLIVLPFIKVSVYLSPTRYRRTSLSTLVFIKLNGLGRLSPSCLSSPFQLMDDLRSLAGVPVFRRPSLKPASAREEERPALGEAASPMRPAGNDSRPVYNVSEIRTAMNKDGRLSYRYEFRQTGRYQCR